MSRFRNFLIPFSLAAGATAFLTTWWIRQGRVNRSALVGNTEELTWQALRQLNVAAEARMIPVNGLELHTIVAGPLDGSLVILLHGFPECWYTWRKQIKPLVEAGYRVVVPDQRGYNLSDKPQGIHNYRVEALASDVVELIRSCGREKAIVVGHDWGGMVAWHLAMHHPEVVEKLIVMNGPHPATFLREISSNPAQQRKSWYMGFFQLPIVPEELLGHDPIETARYLFRRNAVNQEAFSSFDIHVMATALAQPEALTSALNWYRALVRDQSAREKICPIETPTLLIWAEDDVALGRSLTYGLEQWISDLRLHYIPHCGHWVQNEAADEVNEQLAEFLAT
ncbi:MAG TPA: alpha/beta hydrolase [Anaerolineae bacterium]|nr:alpha/beta hydrolase [Anaerolineae bacterium]